MIYRLAGSGTPFDLNLLSEVPGLDVNGIYFIRLVDIVGDGQTLDNTPAFVEIDGVMVPTGCPCPVYDPYGAQLQGANGFDLDGIAMLHAGEPNDPDPDPEPPPEAVTVPVPPLALLFALFGVTAITHNLHRRRTLL